MRATEDWECQQLLEYLKKENTPKSKKLIEEIETYETVYDYSLLKMRLQHKLFLQIY